MIHELKNHKTIPFFLLFLPMLEPRPLLEPRPRLNPDIGGGGAAALAPLTCPRPWPAPVPGASSCSSSPPPSIARRSQLLLGASAGSGRTWRWPGRLGTRRRAAGSRQMGVVAPGAKVRQAAGGEKCGGWRAERKCGVRAQRAAAALARCGWLDAEHQLDYWRMGLGNWGVNLGP